MPKLKVGVIPQYRLSEARKARDAWAPVLREEGATAVSVSIFPGGFGVEAAFPGGPPRMQMVEGVPVRFVTNR